MRGGLVGLTLALLTLSLTSTPRALAGQQAGENSAYAREQGKSYRFYYVSGGNGDGQVKYICRAFPGMTQNDNIAAAVWQVQRFTYDSSNRISAIAFAGDDDGYGQICDNRASLDYS